MIGLMNPSSFGQAGFPGSAAPFAGGGFQAMGGFPGAGCCAGNSYQNQIGQIGAQQMMMGNMMMMLMQTMMMTFMMKMMQSLGGGVAMPGGAPGFGGAGNAGGGIGGFLGDSAGGSGNAGGTGSAGGAASAGGASGASSSGTPGPGVQGALDKARSMLGLQEGRDRAKIQEVTGKSGINPSTTPWCAAFAMNILKDAGVLDLKGLSNRNYCPTIVSWAKDKGIWGQRGSYTPKPGDAIMFDWGRDGTSDHIGIVEKVENGKVITIEGNSSNSVKRNTYELGSGKIMGYVIGGKPHK